MLRLAGAGGCGAGTPSVSLPGRRVSILFRGFIVSAAAVVPRSLRSSATGPDAGGGRRSLARLTTDGADAERQPGEAIKRAPKKRPDQGSRSAATAAKAAAARTAATKRAEAIDVHTAPPTLDSGVQEGGWTAAPSQEATPRPFPAQHVTSPKKWDVVIVGGGHNGLTTAAYLAKEGADVLLLERRHVLGGAANSEEVFPGYTFSRGSYLFSLFRPKIVQDLNLKAHGLELLRRNPSSFTPLLDGRHLMMGPDADMTHREIAKFSARDADAFPAYEAMLDSMVDFIEPFLDEAPVEPHDLSMRQIPQLASLVARGVRLGGDAAAFYEMMTAPASRILNRWFESEPLISTLATDAIVGAMVSPSTPGSGYVLFHHIMGESEGDRGAWSYVRGGMGGVSSALASAARAAGATIETDAHVNEILLTGGRAVGVRMHDGTVIKAHNVVSNATPHVTFERLMSAESLPDDFRRGIQSIDYTSPVTKINIAVDRLPSFACLPNDASNTPGPQHRGTIHLVEKMSEIEAGYQDAVRGRASQRPVIEMTIPSSLDNTLAPPGHHVVQLFTQYTPYAPTAGPWDDRSRNAYAHRCFDVVEEYCPGFKDSVVGVDVLTPPDLERIFGLTGGHICHGAMGLDGLYFSRPFRGWARHRTPIDNLFLCGAGCHPGGGVMGSSGKNCAHVVLEDLSAPLAARRKAGRL